MKVKHFYLLNPIILSIVISCNKNNDTNIVNIEKSVNQISSYSAISSFNEETKTSISERDYFDREKYCNYTNPIIQNEILDIINSYNNKNLLDSTNSSISPAISILTKTRNLTSSSSKSGKNIYACYYPEIYLANAYVMNVLQKLPISPFNKENIFISQDKEKISSRLDWNTDESIKSSRFSKLNGMIRSSLLAEKIAAMDEGRLKYIPRFYGSIDNKKIYLFGLQEEIKRQNYYNHIQSLANALAAIGYYERALYRWSGIFTNEELHLKTELPNDNLQDEIDERSHNKNETQVAVINIIAYDLMQANEKARFALTNKFCAPNSDAANIPAHEINICSEMKKIFDKSIKIDLKRLICTNGNKYSQVQDINNEIFNDYWEIADCDNFLEKNKKLENLNIDVNGNSYYEFIPSYLSPLKLNEHIDNLQTRLKNIVNDNSVFNTLQTKDYHNKKDEINDNIAALEDKLNILKRTSNVAAEDLAFYEFQKQTAATFLSSANLDIVDNEKEQKNQFMIYANNISTIDKLKNLKNILTETTSQKIETLKKYKIALCGSDEVNDCSSSGILGIYSKILKDREESVSYSWKNQCTRMVRQRNDFANAIGENGCNLSELTDGVSLEKTHTENLAKVYSNLNKGQQLTQLCNAAALAEVVLHSKNNKFIEAFALNPNDNDYLNKLQKKHNEFMHSLNTITDAEQFSTSDIKTTATTTAKTTATTESSGPPNAIISFSSSGGKTNTTTESTTNSTTISTSSGKTTLSASSTTTGAPTHDSLLKSNFSFAKAISEAHISKIYLENELFTNEKNLHLLNNPEGYCDSLLESSKNHESNVKITSLLDSKILDVKNQLDKLQLNRSLNNEEIDLQTIITEKINNIDNQINSILVSQNKLEDILEINANLRSIIEDNIKNGSSYSTIYSLVVNAINYSPIKNAKVKKQAQETLLRAAEKKVTIAKENLEIAKTELYNHKLSIERARIRANTKNAEYFLFTSLSPNLSSFSDKIFEIDFTKQLAKKVISLAAARILNMNPEERKLTSTNNHYTSLISALSEAKYNCSYLSSFDDAQICINKTKNLIEYFLPNKETKNSNIDTDLNIQIFSSDLRDELYLHADTDEQNEDNNLLDSLNNSGSFNFNLNEDLLVKKWPSLLGKFNSEYYKARIVGIIANIYMKGHIKSRNIRTPYRALNKIAYLTHEGLRDSASQGACPDSYLEFSEKLFNNFMQEVFVNNEIKDEYKKFGKQLPFLFSKYTAQQLTCNTNHVISSLEVLSPSSTIRFIDADNQEKPLSYFVKSDNLVDPQSQKLRSLAWFSNLNKDTNSAPSKTDNYWQSLTGFISDKDNTDISANDYIDAALKCLSDGSTNKTQCENANDILNQSFSGYPLLGEYKFIYGKHAADKYVNNKLPPNKDKIAIRGIELQFIIAK